MQINYHQRDLLPKTLFDELEVIVKRYMGQADGENEQVVKMKDDIMESAKQHKFCNPVKYHVKQVGVDPSNRDGEGLSDLRAQSRVMVIKCGGFSLPTIRPNCVTMQENPFNKRIEKFTLLQCSKSQKYARYKPNMIRAGTLGAGHATHGFAQLYDEVPCDLPKISENGKMSKAICYQDKGIREACEDGLWYDESHRNCVSHDSIHNSSSSQHSVTSSTWGKLAFHDHEDNEPIASCLAKSGHE